MFGSFEWGNCNIKRLNPLIPSRDGIADLGR
jgi:hypothetical protein